VDDVVEGLEIVLSERQITLCEQDVGKGAFDVEPQHASRVYKLKSRDGLRQVA